MIKVRPYLHHAPVPDGVYFGSARGQLVLSGPPILAGVADKIVPLLETGATEDDLVAAVGYEKSRRVVRHIVGSLRDRGLLVDFAKHTAPEPDPAERSAFDSSVTHLEAYSDDPYAAFARFRAATVAVTGPAAAAEPARRGLRRAGVGTVRAGDDHIGADVVILIDGDPATVPAGVPVVPVVRDDRVLLVGPVVSDVDSAAAWAALRDRVSARAADAPPVARPVADALAGALAARLAFDLVTGLLEPGTAQVVHGEQLTAEPVRAGAPVAVAEFTLDDAPVEAEPDHAAVVDALAALRDRWTGRFAAGPSELDLPQVPVSQRELAHRVGADGSVFAWAYDFETATVGVALAALRGCGPSDAAGLTVETWLLDGALRLLAGRAEELDPIGDDELHPETRRIARIFTGQSGQPYGIGLYHVPGLQWRLARVTAADGRVLGAAWAAGADLAVRDALATALSAAQVRSLRPEVTAEPPVRTDALVFAAPATVGALRKQITALAASEGRVFHGTAVRGDDVLGDLPIHYGPVAYGPAPTGKAEQ
ncbi:hypothetical protein [Dactylosporangium sp. NPDC051484]|uniref:hypothetical protein n=1 Tax=Dactylosporangium sp. NPDC051484 TaxID=3154942 RepID=UPI0034509577